MKTFQKFVWLAAGFFAISLVMSCTLVDAKAGHKIKTHFNVGTPVSTPRALSASASNLSGVAKAAPNAGVHSRSIKLPRALTLGAGGSGSRDLSAANDIADISFSLVNNSHPGNGEDFTEAVDASYPYVDLILTPGDSYTAKVVVNTTDTAPGHSVGITQYGDTKEFTVPEDADWMYPYSVDLFIKPSSAYVFLPGLVSSAGYTYVKYFDQADASQTVKTATLAAATIVGNPRDRFFYGPDGALYFFSYTQNEVYIWSDIAVPIDVANDWVAYTIPSAHIEAVAADPYSAGYLYFIDVNTTSKEHSINYSYIADGNPYFLGTIGALSLDYGAMGMNHATGMAVYLDEYYSYTVLVSFCGTEPNDYYYPSFTAGVLKMDLYGTINSFYPAAPVSAVDSSLIVPDDTTVPMDVAYENGRVYVLCVPAGGDSTSGIYPDYNYPSQYLQGGRSDLWILDTDLAPLSGYSALDAGVTTPYIGFSATQNGKLLGPNRFIAPMRDGKLYIGQWPDFVLTNNAVPWASTINLDGTQVNDGPVSSNAAN